MKLTLISTAIVAGFIFAIPAAPAGAANKYQCFTDDGYGRKFPCSARYKRENPNWRQSNQCFTDEGNGRWRPCDSFFGRTGQAPK